VIPSPSHRENGMRAADDRSARQQRSGTAFRKPQYVCMPSRPFPAAPLLVAFGKQVNETAHGVSCAAGGASQFIGSKFIRFQARPVIAFRRSRPENQRHSALQGLGSAGKLSGFRQMLGPAPGRAADRQTPTNAPRYRRGNARRIRTKLELPVSFHETRPSPPAGTASSSPSAQ